jgi:hypothetical protein
MRVYESSHLPALHHSILSNFVLFKCALSTAELFTVDVYYGDIMDGEYEYIRENVLRSTYSDYLTVAQLV